MGKAAQVCSGRVLRRALERQNATGQSRRERDRLWQYCGHLATCHLRLVTVTCFCVLSGRVEARTYYQITAPSHLHGRSEWKGLKTIGAAVRVYEENGVEKRDIRYFISSLQRNGKQFANAVRSHWGIENSLHWSLDMTYREDESRVRKRTFAENLFWLRRMTLSLIKQHPGKESNIMKRRMAGWSVDYLMQILTGKAT